MKRIASVGLALLALLTVVPSVWGAEYKWKVLVAASYVSPLTDTTNSVGDVIETASSTGWEIGAEWKPGKLIGVELDYLNVTNDIEVDGIVVSEVDINPINVSANFHLIPGQVIDFWVGPTVAFVGFDVEGQEFDDETTFGAVLGLDIGLGQNFAITTGARWLDLSAEDEFGNGFDIDPFFLRVGAAFRF